MLLPVTTENTLWTCRPSQWMNFKSYFGALILTVGIGVGAAFYPLAVVLLVIPVGWALWRFFVVRSMTFELTNERLRTRHGVLNQVVDSVELYRIKDSSLRRPLWLRLLGLSHLSLVTSDRTTSELVIPAVARGDELRDLLLKQVERVRDLKRVREIDFTEGGTDGDDMEFV